MTAPAPPRWDRAALADAATALEVGLRAVAAARDPLARGPAAGWSGPAADAAADAGLRLAVRGAELVDGAVALVGPVRRAAAPVRPDAPGAGAVAAPGAAGSAPADDVDEAADRDLAAALDATALDAAALDATAVTPRRVVPPAPAPATAPAMVTAWWAALDPAARDALVRDRPDLVGGLDGIPAADRDRANRARLAAARQDAAARAGAADRALPVDVLRARWIGDLARIGRRRAEIRARLERLTAVEDSLRAPERALLAFDDAPVTTRAAVATGDVDTARNIGVFTPGFTAGVADLSGRLAELEGIRAAAGPDTAMVAWYGYDAPQWRGLLDPSTSVLGDRPARAGAQRLSRFLDGIDPRAHVTAIGHSYGSVTTALATAPGAADGVDDVVVLGSPGIGPRPTRPPGREWVVEAPGDPVADAAWFGPDPNRMPGVVGLSAREVVLPDGRVLAGSRGHNQYLTPGTTSAYDIAAVVAGRPDAAVLDRGVGAGDRLRASVPGAG